MSVDLDTFTKFCSFIMVLQILMVINDIVSALWDFQRLPGQDPYTRWERIPLLLNTGDGKFYDASTNIEGQEDGVSPVGHTFGHEILWCRW